MTTENVAPGTEPVTPPEGQAPVETTPPEPQAPLQPQGQTPAELRAHAERQEQAAKNFREQLLEERLVGMGLTKDKGVGKAIFQSYDGDDLGKDAITEYARTEWGHEAPATPAAQAADGAERAGQLDAAANQTTPSQIPDQDAQIDAQMMDPEKLSRPVVESSITSKIGRFISSNR